MSQVTGNEWSQDEYWRNDNDVLTTCYLMGQNKVAEPLFLTKKFFWSKKFLWSILNAKNMFSWKKFAYVGHRGSFFDGRLKITIFFGKLWKAVWGKFYECWYTCHTSLESYDPDLSNSTLKFLIMQLGWPIKRKMLFLHLVKLLEDGGCFWTKFWEILVHFFPIFEEMYGTTHHFLITMN